MAIQTTLIESPPNRHVRRTRRKLWRHQSYQANFSPHVMPVSVPIRSRSIRSIRAWRAWADRVAQGFLATPDYNHNPCAYSFRYEHDRRLFTIDQVASVRYWQTIIKEIEAHQFEDKPIENYAFGYRSPEYDLAHHLAAYAGQPLTSYAEHPSWLAAPLYMEYVTAGPRWRVDPDLSEYTRREALKLVGRLGLAAAFLMSGVVEIHAAGNTYWVATTGSDSNPGTEALPKRNVWTATGGVSLMSSGDMLIIKNGSYQEHIVDSPGVGTVHVPGGTVSTPTVIRADTGATVTFNPTLNVQTIWLFKQPGNYIEFRDIILDGVNLTGSYTSPAYCFFHLRQDGLRTTGWKFLRLTVKRCPVTAFYYDSGTGMTLQDCIGFDAGTNATLMNNFYIQTDTTLIRGCQSYYSTYNPNWNNGGIRNAANGSAPASIVTNFNVFERCLAYNCRLGIIMGCGNNNIARNNICRDNDHGIQVWADKSANWNKIYNTTFHRNRQYGVYIGGGSGAPATNTIVKNNIFWQNTSGAVLNQGSGTIQSNNATADPLFVNSAMDDYHLRDGSPAIDAGVDLSPDVTDDRDGVLRPPGSAYDMGAYEASTGASSALSPPADLSVR